MASGKNITQINKLNRNTFAPPKLVIKYIKGKRTRILKRPTKILETIFSPKTGKKSKEDSRSCSWKRYGFGCRISG